MKITWDKTPLTSGYPGCTICYRPPKDRPDTAWAADPREEDGLVYACRPCHRALAAGLPVDLPRGAELAGVWEHIADLRDAVGLPDEVVWGALAGLAWWLPPQVSHEAWETYVDADERIRHAEDPSTVLDTELTGPEFDGETYVIHWQAIRAEALAKLTGVRR